MADAYGRNRIAVSIASADNIVINKAILEENASELVLIDEHALKNCLGASTLPCIVFLPEISLDKLLSMMEKPNVSGLSGNIVNENCKGDHSTQITLPGKEAFLYIPLKHRWLFGV